MTVKPPPISEKDLQAEVKALAEGMGWLVYHTWNSQRSDKGLPDLLMVKGHRLIAAELKSDKGKLTPEQNRWLQALALVRSAEAMVIRPGADYSELIDLLR